MDPGWLYSVVVIFDRVGSYTEVEFQNGMKAFKHAKALIL